MKGKTMLYIKASNDTVEVYPYSIGRLRKDNPNTSFPKQPSLDDLASFNVFPVTEVTPTIAEGEKLVKNWTPTLVSGQWVLQHQTIPKTTEDLATETTVAEGNLRAERNKLLAATDFYALTDVTMSPEMTTYRQALRDLPANTVDVFNPVYPEL
jgi:hypothetical protein